MIGNQIKKLRSEREMTQKELADLLFVSPQAVSRWENEEVEPSVATITKLAEIFGVSTDFIFGKKEAEPKVVVEKEYVYQDAPQPVLAVCSQCNRPIYKGSEIVRKKSYHRGGSSETIYCRECDEKNRIKTHESAVREGLLRRKRSFVWGTVGALAMLGIMIGVTVSQGKPSLIPLTVILPIIAFTLISCCFLGNNFIGDVVATVAGWGIKFPGLIFELDLEGIIWFITVKITLAILSFLFSAAMTVLALAIGGALSIFVYPYAIRKNYLHPEKSVD